MATERLRIHTRVRLTNATMVLAFTGWMDGGDVSTGTVARLVHLLEAKPIADIDPEPFYIYNFPGSMEVAALFRPHIEIEDGLIKTVDMPTNTFFCHEPDNLILLLGKEPNLHWQAFGDSILKVAQDAGVERILFVGSFGGAVPHTREPRLYVTVSDGILLPDMQEYGLRLSNYDGPGSFTAYLMTRAESVGLDMVSLAAEIPGYLQGTNPLSIEAVTRRLAKILNLPLDLAELRSASNEWETKVTEAVAQDDDLATKVRELEEQYDNDLIGKKAEEEEESV